MLIKDVLKIISGNLPLMLANCILYHDYTTVTLTDKSGNNANGTIFNTVTLNSQGAYIDGSAGSYVNANILPLQNIFTIRFLLKASVLADYNQWIGVNDSWGSFTFHASANGTIYCGTNVVGRFVIPNCLSANTWVEICYVYNNGNAKFFSDGILRNTTTHIAPTQFTTFRLGRSSNSEGIGSTINGTVKYLQLYNTALSDTEVSQLYSLSKAQFGF